MANHPNFYENITEAQQRLLNTLVKYGDEPCKVVAITEHKDKIFRVYLLPIPFTMNDYPDRLEGFRHGSAEQAEYLDTFMKAKGADCKLLRKQMNSPQFNRFRPFSLGMANYDGNAKFLQRQPQRTREQGLTRSTILETNISLKSSDQMERTYQRGTDTKEMRDCILGVYPSFQECVKELTDPSNLNDSAAFHRNFAIIKGPLKLLFLVYKTDCIGLINNDGSLLLAKEFKQCRELVEELNVFQRINQQ